MCGGVFGRNITPSDSAATPCRLAGLCHIFTSFLFCVVGCAEPCCYLYVFIKVADTISAEFVLAILPSGKIAPKPFVISLEVECAIVHLGHWGIFANLPSTTGCAIAIECYDLFLERIKFDFGDMKVLWIFAFNGCFWYNGPAVVFCICRFSHSFDLCHLKNRHLTDDQGGYRFVGVVIARNHPIHELNLVPMQMGELYHICLVVVKSPPHNCTR